MHEKNDISSHIGKLHDGDAIFQYESGSVSIIRAFDNRTRLSLFPQKKNSARLSAAFLNSHSLPGSGIKEEKD